MGIAETVIIRGRPDYKFDVDGLDIPWWINERGAKVTQIKDDLFVVNIEIVCLPKVLRRRSDIREPPGGRRRFVCMYRWSAR